MNSAWRRTATNIQLRKKITADRAPDESSQVRLTNQWSPSDHSGVRSFHLYSPDHLNRINKLSVGEHGVGDAPVAVRCDDADVGQTEYIQHFPQHLGDKRRFSEERSENVKNISAQWEWLFFLVVLSHISEVYRNGLQAAYLYVSGVKRPLVPNLSRQKKAHFYLAKVSQIKSRAKASKTIAWKKIYSQS